VGPDVLFGILDAAAATHDLVVINGGAALHLSDALSWAVASDITVLAIQLGRTTRRDLRRVVTNMQAQGVRIAGVVLLHSGSDIGHRAPLDLTDGKLAGIS
jgi:Mrp family chromosome partitioning ATPase